MKISQIVSLLMVTIMKFLICSSIIFFMILFFGETTVVSAQTNKDNCVECHSNPKLHITNKKLYKYFQDWELSIHKQEGISCADCHGGNPNASNKKKAHGKGIKQLLNAVEYENIVNTCGKCHQENFKHYQQSKHYEILSSKNKLYQAPTCINCHDSINTLVPNSNTVRMICSRCHNVITEISPEMPEKAEYLMDKLSFINHYLRYIIFRRVEKQSPHFFNIINAEISKLAEAWHTFDLQRIEKKTIEIRKLLSEKRKELIRNTQ